jgi:hypothetical protein
MHAESASRKQRFSGDENKRRLRDRFLVVEGDVYGTLLENLLSIKVFAQSTRK